MKLPEQLFGLTCVQVHLLTLLCIVIFFYKSCLGLIRFDRAVLGHYQQNEIGCYVEGKYSEVIPCQQQQQRS